MNEIMEAEKAQRRVDKIMALIAGCLFVLVLWAMMIIL